MFTLFATKLFTSGLLAGITYEFTMEFVTEQAAIDWATWAEKGCEKPIGGSPYRVINWSVRKS